MAESAQNDSALSSPYRIAFVNTHPIQYFAPMYAYLNSLADFDISAIYMSDFSLRGAHDKGFGQSITWDIDLLAGYTPIFAGDAAKTRSLGGFTSIIAPEIASIIKEGQFDAIIIHGHYMAGHYVALINAKRFGIPVFLRGETHLNLKRPKAKEALRKAIYKPLFRLFNGFLAIGSANAEYYRSMGIDNNRISLVPYTVDNNRFINATKTALCERETIRLKLGLDKDAIVILFASKFEPRKRADELIDAFARLKTNKNVQLLMVGAGQDEEALHQKVSDEHIENVIFTGFINQTELPRIFSASDLFVLPSDNEPWGLIVNEAMCASLPIIITSDTGSAQDLVENGVNGFIYDAGDIDALTESLKLLIEDDALRQSAAKASLEKINHWSYAECAEGLRDAMKKVHPSN